MHLESLIPAPDRQVEAGIVGVGEFGRSFLSQAQRVPGMRARVACDQDVERARDAFIFSGIAVDDVLICEDRAAAIAAFESGRFVVVEDPQILVQMPLDMVVEATGHPETAAGIAEQALANGRHVAMVTKEAESVVGPLLARRAAEAGLVYTPVDGDQPSLLIGLVSWSRLLGLEIVAAGKASEYDFLFDPSSSRISSQDQTLDLPDFAKLWAANGISARELVEQRLSLLQTFWHRTVPDLCEMTIVANATGLVPDVPSLHAPVARTLELPDFFAAEEDGGLLGRDGVVDMFNCLRRPDELSFAGGVFVVARTPDQETGRLFKEKGIPVSADNRRVLVHNPVHLLGAEAPMSILSACRAGKSTGGADIRPRVDLTARTTRTIRAGTKLEIGWRHTIDGIEAEMTTARGLSPHTALPHYLLPGCTANADIPAGAPVTLEMIEPPRDSVLWRLRREQDALFGTPC